MASDGSVVVRFLGDASQFKRAASEAEGAAGGFQGKLNKISGDLAGFGTKMTTFVTAPIIAGFGLAAKAAAEEGQEMAVLANTMRNTVGATEAQVAATEEWITATQNATGVSDGQLRPALGKLLIAGRSVEQAQKDMAVALDIAAARGVSVEAVTNAMAKASLGNVGALGRLGVATKDASGETLTFDEILQQASRTMGGSAATAADTAAGKAAIMQAKLADLVEEIGSSVLPIMEKLVGFVSGAAEAFSGMPAPVQTAVLALAGVAAAAGPILTVVGNVQKLKKTMEGFSVSSFAAKSAWLGVVGVLTAGAVALSAAGESIDSKVRRALDDLSKKSAPDLARAFQDAGSEMKTFEAIAQANLGTAIKLRDELKRQGEQTTELDKIIAKYVGEQANAESSTKAAAEAVQELTGELDENTDALMENLEATLAAFNAEIAYKDQINRTEDAIAEMNGKLLESIASKGKDATKTEEYERALLDAQSAVLSQAASLARMAADQAKANGQTLSGKEAARIQREELERVAATLAPGHPLRVSLEGYIATMRGVERSVHTNVTVDTSEAERRLQRIRQIMADIGRDSIFEQGPNGRRPAMRAASTKSTGREGGTSVIVNVHGAHVRDDFSEEKLAKVLRRAQLAF